MQTDFAKLLWPAWRRLEKHVPTQSLAGSVRRQAPSLQSAWFIVLPFSLPGTNETPADLETTKGSCGRSWEAGMWSHNGEVIALAIITTAGEIQSQSRVYHHRYGMGSLITDPQQGVRNSSQVSGVIFPSSSQNVPETGPCADSCLYILAI